MALALAGSLTLCKVLVAGFPISSCRPLNQQQCHSHGLDPQTNYRKKKCAHKRPTRACIILQGSSTDTVMSKHMHLSNSMAPAAADTMGKSQHSMKDRVQQDHVGMLSCTEDLKRQAADAV